MIFKNDKELKQKEFSNEKELQTYFEKNLMNILGLQFIDTEFWIDNHTFRIDSLAYDKDSNSFRIIEYKNIENHSLVDQGFTYLKKMLENKEAFILDYNLKTNSQLGINDIDWSQSRIIFVSPKFSKFQLNSTGFADMPFDLYKITKYEDDIMEIDKLESNTKVKLKDSGISIANEQVTKEIKVYTEDDHTNQMNEKTKELYIKLRDEILGLDDIDLEPKKLYVAFKGSHNIVAIRSNQGGRSLRIYINMKSGTLNDPMHITQDVTDKGHWATGDYIVDISKEDDLDNLIPLIKQSIKVNKK